MIHDQPLSPFEIASRELNHLYSEDYFSALVMKLENLIGSDFTMIGLFDHDLKSAESLSFINDGKIIENITYNLEGTPCRDLADKGLCVYPEKVAEAFPQDEILKEMGIEAYLGIALRNSKGKVTGLMVGLFKKKIEHVEYSTEIMDLFSMRASAEVERYQFEKN
jgi:hypothetical protein